ncbi:catalase [Marmoricola sp. OAE513]|uniref:catalase family peroxidase n=1 Tax=Marmoricola sp. OAE513 TaxID=2817894 RepID=UPI001AE5DA73
MLDPERAIDRINGVFGSHPGHRALHARGGFFAGTFAASPEAAALCRAGHLQGEPVPVRVRWSNGGGNPGTPDTAPDVRGMAVSFRLADGTATDLLGQTAPRFPVRTPEDFVAFVEASRNPVNLPLFLLKHRSALPAMVANVRAKAIVPPRSYAEATYYPVHAYRWTAADGAESWVRYRLEPLPGTAPDQKFEGSDRLRQEILARLVAGPVTYDLRVTVAAPGDDPHDPMSVWKGARELSAGTLTITAPDPQREQDGEVVVFDPTRVVDGIGISDDPILRYRAGAYSASVSRRT